MSVQGVLTEIGPAAARRDAHGKSTLDIIENEPVLAAVFDRQHFDFAFCKFHGNLPYA